MNEIFASRVLCEVCFVERRDPSPPYFDSDCPQSSSRGASSAASSSSSGSCASDSSIRVKRSREMSRSVSSGGSARLVRAKYGITRNAATGLSKTDPSSSAIM
jgi:hypothetical protein